MADASFLNSSASGPSGVASSYASSIFPSVDASTIALIDAVVNRIPEERNDWKPILSAYQDVLQEHGLDVERDTHVYALLLRLGMERGRDWRAKWEGVKNRQREQEAPAARHSAVAQRKSENVRGIDDVFTTPHKLPGGPVGNAMTAKQQSRRLPLTRAALDELQVTASPYKAIAQQFLQAKAEADAGKDREQRPAVHFIDNNPNQPIRTEVPDKLLSQLQRLDILPTKASLSERELDLAEAVRFDRISLLGRIWDDWLSRMAVLEKIDQHALLARNALLQRRALQRWTSRAILHRRLDLSADRAAESSLQRRLLMRWRDKVIKKRKDAWEKQINSAYRAIVKKRDRHAKVTALNNWHLATLDSRSDRFRRSKLLHSCLSKWLERSAYIAELHAAVGAQVTQKQHDLLIGSWRVWKLRTTLIAREDDFVSKRNTIIAVDALRTWMKRLHDVELADSWWGMACTRTFFQQWQVKLGRVEALQASALALSSARDVDTQERVFRIWRIKEHGALLTQARSARLVRAVFAHWQNKHSIISDIYQVQAVGFRGRCDKSVLKIAFSKWYKCTSSRKTRLVIAASLANRLSTQRAFATWRRRIGECKVDERKAQVARDFFSQRAGLRQWAEVVNKRKQARWIAQRQRSSLQHCFTTWQQLALTSRNRAILCEVIESAIDQRVLTNALSQWIERTVTLRQRARRAGHDADRSLVRKAFKQWQGRLFQCQEDLSLVDSFRDVKEEEGTMRYFRKWRNIAKRNRLLRLRLAEYTSSENRALLSGYFEHWLDRTKEQSLVVEAQQVLQYRQQQMLRVCLTRWQSATLALPAIRFDTNRLRRLAIDKWLAALPLRIEANKAVEHDRTRILGVTFRIWEEARRSKAARRAANRFRAFATNLHTPRGYSISTQELARPSSGTRSTEYSIPLSLVVPKAVPPLRVNYVSRTPMSAAQLRRELAAGDERSVVDSSRAIKDRRGL